MATMLEECATKQQNSVVHCLWAKALDEKNIHKEMFRVYSGKCCCVKQFTSVKTATEAKTSMLWVLTHW
jgi:hypothetical protein